MDFAGMGDAGNVLVDAERGEGVQGSLGLGEALELVGDDEGNLLELVDAVAAGHNE